VLYKSNGESHFKVNGIQFIINPERCRYGDLIASLCVPAEVDLVYRDVDGGVTLFNAENLTTRVLMTNSTFVSTFHILIASQPALLNN
jgi:hypothetical protein